jgi:hypothetical protein
MSKLSLHISDWLNPDLTYEFIERTRPHLIKVFGDAGLDDAKIREAKTRSPASVFVGRMYFPEQGIERDEKTPVDTVFNYDPIADARSAFNQMRGIMEKTRGLVTIWEGYNEIPIDTAQPVTERERQKARNYNAFTVEMARLMHEAGLQYAAYSFSTGNPVHVELWDLLEDGLRASDFLALHEYIAPDESFSEFDFSMCNRYRQFYTRLPQAARKPILITECGVDYLGQQGFKGKISVPKYLSMMGQYDAELMKDPYVVGATIYCYGINAPQWKTYDIGGDFAKAMRDYILNTPTPPLENPIVEPQPVAPQPAPGVALLADILAMAKQARADLENQDSDGARALLTEKIIPWFYASAPAHSTDLANAQAHTTARWFAEEATRRIEAGKLDEAKQILSDHVIAWLESPGPRALGILAMEMPAAPETAETAPVSFGAAPAPKPAAKKKRAPAKKKAPAKKGLAKTKAKPKSKPK